jgi:hypothetical protein
VPAVEVRVRSVTYVDREKLRAFLARLDSAFGRPGRLYLVGETTLLAEGWRDWAERIEIASEIEPDGREALAAAIERVAGEMGIEVIDEFPGDVIPLPDGWETRTRPVGPGLEPVGAAAAAPRALQLAHFDPYSVSIRFIARGDEPDYHLTLSYLRHGWITIERLDELLEALLPRFTQRTIQQDPAEFRRKYHGLLQMARAVRPFEIHRATPA